MKNTIKAKGPITKPLLAGLVVPMLDAPTATQKSKEEPSFGKTNENSADFMHDSGNGFNSDLTYIQE